MDYTLVNNTPKNISFDFKETISTLINDLTDNLPVVDKNVIKVQEVNQIEKKINQIYNFLELLLLANNHQFSDFHYNISAYLKNIVDKCFTRVTKFNNKTNSNEYCITSIILNDKTYKYQPYNKGNINFGNSFISGKYSDFVTTYNGYTGDVFGASGIIINDDVKYPNSNGLVELNGLIDFSHGLVKTFNNSDGYIKNMLSTVTSGNPTNYITYNQNNQGIIYIDNILSSLIDENLYVRNGNIRLSGEPSAITPDQDDNNLLRIATTKYVKKNLIEKVAGYNEIRVFKEGWITPTGSNISYFKVTIPSGIAYIRSYRKKSAKDPMAYIVDPTCSTTITFDNTNNYMTNMILSANSGEIFDGKISIFQDIHQIGQNDFQVSYVDNNNNRYIVQGWNNPSKINHVTIPPKINNIPITRHYFRNLQNMDVIEILGGGSLETTTVNISFLDVSNSTLDSIFFNSGNYLKLSKLPSTLKRFFFNGTEIQFEELSLWNNCKYIFYGYCNLSGVNIALKEKNSLHVISSFYDSANPSKRLFRTLFKKNQPEFYQTNNGLSVLSAELPVIQSLNMDRDTIKWYIYCGKGTVEDLKKVHFDIDNTPNSNKVSAYIYNIGVGVLWGQSIQELHVYRDPQCYTKNFWERINN